MSPSPIPNQDSSSATDFDLRGIDLGGLQGDLDLSAARKELALLVPGSQVLVLDDDRSLLYVETEVLSKVLVNHQVIGMNPVDDFGILSACGKSVSGRSLGSDESLQMVSEFILERAWKSELGFVLTDFHMQKFTGATVVQQVRQMEGVIPESKRVPFICITSEPSDAKQSGADFAAVIKKPVSIDGLVYALREQFRA